MSSWSIRPPAATAVSDQSGRRSDGERLCSTRYEAPVGECTDQALADVDYLLLGCWTQGLLIVRQHPDEFWADFARKLPALTAPHVGLFATYKIATGSMFRRMRRHLDGKVGEVELELKSRNGRLSRRQQSALERFIG